MKKFLLTAILILSIVICQAQDKTPDGLIEDKYLQQDEANYDQMYETMIQYLNDPLDINTINQDQLESLGILNPFQIQNFFEYRSTTGSFLSLFELQAIRGFDMATIQSLLPFVILKNTSPKESLIKRMLHNKNNYLITQSGITFSKEDNSKYIGQNNPIYLRYRNSKINDFSIGFTLKNDIGEPLQWNPQKHYYITDFSSFHFTLYKKGFIKTISIGDYKLQFGQGLVNGGGFNLGKGGETILSTKQNNTGIIPSTSASEFNTFRGVAICIPVKKWEGTAYLSYKNIDGNKDSINDSFTKITSSYHRTATELNRRKNTHESNAGFNIHYTASNKRLHLGISGITTWFEKTLLPATQLYNQFQFKGKTNSVIGSDINYLYKNFNFFGELAISKNGGTGTVLGFISSLNKSVDAVILIRNYDKDFQSFYSNGFSEGSSTSNEKGIYTGLKIRPVNKVEVAFYFDRFQFPWLKYQTYGISRGYEYLSRILYTPTRASELSIQIREENKETNSDGESEVYYTLEERLKRNYQISYRIKTSPFRLGSRVQYSTIKTSNTLKSGYAIIQDIEYIHRRFQLACRVAMFDTDDYDNRQYVYERNFIYNFSITSYYGKGTRFYAMLRYKLSSNLDIWMRCAATSYEREKDKNETVFNTMLLFKL